MTQDIAYPDWDDLTPAERNEERALGGASAYQEHFEYGLCVTDREEDATLAEDGTCLSCGGGIRLLGPEADRHIGHDR